MILAELLPEQSKIKIWTLSVVLRCGGQAVQASSNSLLHTTVSVYVHLNARIDSNSLTLLYAQNTKYGEMPLCSKDCGFSSGCVLGEVIEPAGWCGKHADWHIKRCLLKVVGTLLILLQKALSTRCEAPLQH